MDLDTDVASAIETKWLYIETPATGAGSFLPWIPFESMIMAGALPWRGTDYKTGILLSGDGPGFTLRTNWTPDIRSTFSYVMVGQMIDDLQAPGANNNWAIAASLEADIFKGLTVKPTFAYASIRGGNCGTNNLGSYAYAGYQPNTCGGNNVTSTGGATFPNLINGVVPASPLDSWRYTIGGDVRWTIGGFSLQPTFYYQWGTAQSYTGGNVNVTTLNGLPSGPCPAGQVCGKRDNNISAFLFDTIAGYRIGPLNMQGRFMYTPGTPANQVINNGADLNAYRQINSGFGYMSGWTELQVGGIDYIMSGLMVGSTEGLVLRSSPSYDKYGRIWAGTAIDYSLTPALVFTALGNISWTANKVNTNSLFSTIGLIPCPGRPLAAFGARGLAHSPNPASPNFTGCVSNGRGNADQYYGTEAALGMTYRFAPNVALDLAAGYMWTGSALNNAGVAGNNVPAGFSGNVTQSNHEADNLWRLS